MRFDSWGDFTNIWFSPTTVAQLLTSRIFVWPQGALRLERDTFHTTFQSCKSLMIWCSPSSSSPDKTADPLTEGFWTLIHAGGHGHHLVPQATAAVTSQPPQGSAHVEVWRTPPATFTAWHSCSYLYLLGFTNKNTFLKRFKQMTQMWVRADSCETLHHQHLRQYQNNLIFNSVTVCVCLAWGSGLEHLCVIVHGYPTRVNQLSPH